MQIIQRNLGIVVVTTISEGVDGCDIAFGTILDDGTNAPGIVGVAGYSFGILIHDLNDITLEILVEVERRIIVKDTTDRLLVVVQRNQGILVGLCRLIVVPALTQNLGAVQGIHMLNAIHGLAGTDAVGIVGIGVTVKGLQLSALFPGQRMAQIIEE